VVFIIKAIKTLASSLLLLLQRSVMCESHLTWTKWLNNKGDLEEDNKMLSF